MKTSHIIIAIAIVVILFIWYKKNNDKTLAATYTAPTNDDAAKAVIAVMPAAKTVQSVADDAISTNTPVVDITKYEGLHIKGSDNAQYIIKGGKKYWLSADEWAKRNYDGFETVADAVITAIPDGGAFTSIK